MAGPRQQSRPSTSGTTYGGWDGDWRGQAACGTATRDEQNILTAGAANNKYSKPAIRMARKFCDNCPVRTQCFNWAKNDVTFTGVAGGFLFGFAAGQHLRAEHRRMVRL